MNILCSGNPNHNTVASAIQKRFPNADFACRTTGFDLAFDTVDSQTCFQNQVCKYDIFINSSNIANGVQRQLLNITHAEWMRLDIKGHIINIGSSIELSDDNSDYAHSKRALRTRSLELSKQTGVSGVKCTHIIASGINDGKPENKNWLDLDDIVKAIDYILQAKHNIPLIHLEP
jgi:hypothetical protein